MKTAPFTISNPTPNCYDLNPHKTISKNCFGYLMLGTWGITKNLPYSLPASYEIWKSKNVLVAKCKINGTATTAVLFPCYSCVTIELQSVANRKKLTYWY